MNPDYVNLIVDKVASLWPELNFRSDTPPPSATLYRGIIGDTQHVVIAQSGSVLHARVYDPTKVELVQQAMKDLSLIPRVKDQYDDFGKIDVDAFLH